MTVAVRRARPEDAAIIAKFALKLFAQHREYDPERFADLSNVAGAERFYAGRSNADEAAVLIAEIDERVIGFAYLEFEQLDYANLLENAAWLHDLYVDETARGTGAGRALIDRAIKEANSLGADKVVLHVAAKNEHASAFFKKAGLRETMVEMTVGLNDRDRND